MTTTCLPFWSSTVRPSASAYLRPSWKMWPISMPRASSSGAPQAGHASPGRTSAASIVPSGVKSRPATRSTTWWPGWSAPVIQRVPATTRGSTRKRMPVADRLAEHPGADVALGQRRVGGEVGLAERLRLGRVHRGLEPLHVDVAVARHADGQRLDRAVGVAQLDDHVLQRVGRRPLAVGAAQVGAGVHQVDERRDRRRVGRVVDDSPAGRRRTARRAAPAPAPPRCWRRSRSSCSARTCPRRPRSGRGTPRWPSRPSPRTSPTRSRTAARGGRTCAM